MNECLKVKELAPSVFGKRWFRATGCTPIPLSESLCARHVEDSIYSGGLTDLEQVQRLNDLFHVQNTKKSVIHCKKSFSIFPSPAGMSHTKLSLGRNNVYI
jgi:hypothetical protein